MTLAQTIRRRILLTAGGALSTTAPGGDTGRAAAAGTVAFGAAGGVAGGVPAGVSTAGSAAARSGLLELSTNETSVSREVQRGWQVGVPYEDTRSLPLQSK